MKTYEVILAEVGRETLFEGLEISQSVQDDLLEWFFDRQVCDNDKFVRYFRREIAMLQHQFNEYLRVETCEFDPMVGQYLERELRDKRMSEGTGKVTSDGANNSQNHGGTETTTTHGTTTTTTNDLTDTVTNNNTQTNDLTQHTTGEVTHGGTVKVDGGSTDDSSSLDGNTPDSATYADAAGGTMPALNWEYTSGQQQSHSEGSNNSLTTNDLTDGTDTTTKNTGTVSTTGGGNTRHEGTVTVGNTGTDNTTVVNNGGTDTTTHNQQDTATKDTSEGLTRERTTGRGEAPQDMLNRARNYILKTNAFAWLVDKLDKCFFQVYDSDWD